MRSLKFRVWDKENTEMFGFRNYKGVMLIDESGYLLRVEYSIGGYDDETKCYATIGTHYQIDKNRYIVQQFTGFKDAVGSEIYEGDILKLADKFLAPYEVQWDEDSGGFRLISAKRDCDDYGVFTHRFIKSELAFARIIGNIFENKELL